jgi:hypothetical protein
LEQSHIVGSMAVTEEITLPAAISISMPLAISSSTCRQRPLNWAGEIRLELLYPAQHFSQAFPDGGLVSMYRDLEKTVAIISRYSRKDGWTRSDWVWIFGK